MSTLPPDVGCNAPRVPHCASLHADPVDDAAPGVILELMGVGG